MIDYFFASARAHFRQRRTIFRVFAIVVAAAIILGPRTASAASICTFAPDEQRKVPPITRGLEEVFFNLEEDFQEPNPLNGEIARLFRWLNMALKAKGVTLVVLPTPTRGMVFRDYVDSNDPAQRVYVAEEADEGFRALIDQLRALGIATIDVTAAVNEASPGEPLFLKRNPYLSSEGSMLLAQAAADFIVQDRSYENLPKIETVARPTAEISVQSSMSVEIRRACREPSDDERQMRYVFEPVGASRLLQSVVDESPSVAVTGSNLLSDDYSNFAGFLSQFTKLQVKNAADQNRSPFSALLRLVSDPGFWIAPPRFLIWETPTSVNLNHEAPTTFRQIIPAVYGICDDASAFAQSTVLTNSPVTSLLSATDLDRRSKDMGQSYLVILAEDSSFPSVGVSVGYETGEMDIFRLGYPSERPAENPFFGWISPEIAARVESIELYNLPPEAGRLRVRLCPLIRPEEPQL